MGASINRAAQVARYVGAETLTQVGPALVSTAFGQTIRFISFIADGPGYFRISTAGGLATASDHRMAEGERVECIVNPGEKLSTLLDAAGSTYLSKLA